MILYCIIGALLYIAVLLRIWYRLRDIDRCPQKYKEIPDWKRYKKSIWYEVPVKRYGSGYYASLIIGIPLMLLIPLVYYYLRVLLHILVPIFGRTGTDSIFWGIGSIACIFFSIGFNYFILFHIHRPMFVAARAYWVDDVAWIYNGKYHLAWRHMFRWMFWCSLICLPFMFVGLIF